MYQKKIDGNTTSGLKRHGLIFKIKIEETNISNFTLYYSFARNEHKGMNMCKVVRYSCPLSNICESVCVCLCMSVYMFDC